jgi:hypothetical protein
VHIEISFELQKVLWDSNYTVLVGHAHSLWLGSVIKDDLRRSLRDNERPASALDYWASPKNLSSAELTSSEWVQQMLYGPPSTGTSVQSEISARRDQPISRDWGR